MDYVRLGKSGPKVSRVGMGAMQASGKDLGFDTTEEDCIQAVGKSLENGVTLLDTAEEYGKGTSERVVGKALKRYGRENFVIATKVYGQHLRYDELQKACRASMERLGINEIDLYQVHWPDPWEQVPLKHTFKALEKLYSEGKIRSIAVSNFAVRDLEEARSLLSRAEIVSNQVRYNLLQREIEEEVLPYCQKNSISILAWSPIAQGALGGKYSLQNPPPDHRKTHSALFRPENMEQIDRLIALLRTIASRHGKTVAQVSLNWLISSSSSVVPIPGALNGVQAEENAGAVGWSLDRDELQQISEAIRDIKISYYP